MVKMPNLFYGLTGIILIWLGLSLPFFAIKTILLLFERVIDSIITDDSGKLIFSVFFYILHQLIMYFLIYLGATFLATSITRKQRTVIYQSAFTCIVFGSIFLLNIVHKDQNAYITQFIMISGALILFHFMPRPKLQVLPFSIVLIQIILSIQWLNLIPSLSNLGFGTDDLATSIKIADAYLTNNKLLNTLAPTFFILFLVLTVFSTLLIYIYGRQIHILKSYQIQERALKNARINILQSRVFKEMHSLVHDLKTPLVSIEGLASLLPLMIPSNIKVGEYSNRIQASVQKMREMISEILNEDIRKEIDMQELIDYTRSHTILDNSIITFSADISPDLPKIQVNKIRFARALTNLIENAFFAIGDATGHIQLNVVNEREKIVLTVTDNGPGIDPKTLDSIWREGFSTKSSTGLGLSFVKTVVQNHGGTVAIKSENGETEVKIILPTGKVSWKNDLDSSD